MGKPAARIGDMHMCPMVTPGMPPIPHVGGPITGPGCPTVLIGGMPAAVMGDMCVCVGPPDTIILGSTGVLIGGKPAARMGDQCAHGGAITLGYPTVLIGETAAGGAGGLAAMPTDALVNVMNSTSPAMAIKIAQIIAFKEAANKGIPSCENFSSSNSTLLHSLLNSSYQTITPDSVDVGLRQFSILGIPGKIGYLSASQDKSINENTIGAGLLSLEGSIKGGPNNPLSQGTATINVANAEVTTDSMISDKGFNLGFNMEANAIKGEANITTKQVNFPSWVPFIGGYNFDVNLDGSAGLGVGIGLGAHGYKSSEDYRTHFGTSGSIGIFDIDWDISFGKTGPGS